MKRLLIILTLAGLPCAPFAQTRLTLDACIEQAEANNKALAAADRQLAAAQFDFRGARANFFPSFSETATALYSPTGVQLISLRVFFLRRPLVTLPSFFCRV